MRSAVIVAALALAIGASATVKIEHGPDGSIRRISKSDSPAPARPKVVVRSGGGGGCSNCRDQCLRGVLSASVADADFCTSFLADTYSQPSDFAPVQTQCASDPDLVSSACSCFVQPTTSSSPSPSDAVPSTTTSASSSAESSSTESSTIETSPTESSSTESSTTETSSSVPSTTVPPWVCTPSSGACTIDNFVDCCTQCCFFPEGDIQDGLCC